MLAAAILVEYVPEGHREQKEAENWSENCPALQAAQDFAPEEKIVEFLELKDGRVFSTKQTKAAGMLHSDANQFPSKNCAQFAALESLVVVDSKIEVEDSYAPGVLVVFVVKVCELVLTVTSMVACLVVEPKKEVDELEKAGVVLVVCNQLGLLGVVLEFVLFVPVITGAGVALFREAVLLDLKASVV